MSDSNNGSGNNSQTQQTPQPAQQPSKPVVPDTYGTVQRRDGDEYIQHKVVRGGSR